MRMKEKNQISLVQQKLVLMMLLKKDILMIGLNYLVYSALGAVVMFIFVWLLKTHQ
jgi:hypothetical protein